jgi:hypothetical protein
MMAYQDRPLRKKVDLDALKTSNEDGIFSGTG